MIMYCESIKAAHDDGDSDFDLGIRKHIHSKDPSRCGIGMEFSRMEDGYSSFGAGYGRNLQPSEMVDTLSARILVLECFQTAT